MNPNHNFPFSNWRAKPSKPFHGNDYISHNKTEYLTPGQKAFLNNDGFDWNANSKENKQFSNWKPQTHFAQTSDKNDEFGFRSNTGQYNNSNENNKGPTFSNLDDHSRMRRSYFDHEDLLASKIEEQEFEFSRKSSIPQNFKLEYIEYNDLPHISQLNPATAK